MPSDANIRLCKCNDKFVLPVPHDSTSFPRSMRAISSESTCFAYVSFLSVRFC